MTDKQEIINWVILGMIVIFIISLVFTIVYLIKNANLIKSDPFMYAMKQHNFTSCSCFDSDGKYYENNGTIFIMVDNKINPFIDAFK
jgi:hypothetical protein